MANLNETDRNKYGGSIYDQKNFTEDELRDAAEIRASAEAGNTKWEDANAYVNEIRSKYGYSGGSDGSKYIQAPRKSTVEKFTYDSAPAYANKYKEQIDELLGKLTGSTYEGFTKGSEYGALKGQYMGAGNAAMQNTVGQLSARTGGIGSSYAGVAGQQVYNGYMDNLRSAAMDLYSNQRSNQFSNVNALLSAQQNDYNQWANDRNFDYGVDQDYTQNRMAQRQQDWQEGVDKWNQQYQLGRDATSDGRYADETTYNRQQDSLNRQDAENQTMQEMGYLLMQYGVTPTIQQLAGLGMTPEQAKQAAQRMWSILRSGAY